MPAKLLKMGAQRAAVAPTRAVEAARAPARPAAPAGAPADGYTRAAPSPDAAHDAAPAHAPSLPTVGRARRERRPPALALEARFRALGHDAGAPLALRAVDVAGVPIASARVVRYTGLAPRSPAETSTTVVVDFGPLERGQWEALHAAFGGRSRVPWVAGARYQADDFLPPKLQALLGRDLELPTLDVLPGSAALPFLPHGEDKTVDLTMNCHATAYEALRAYQGDDRAVSVFLGDGVSMGRLAQSGRFQRVAHAAAAGAADIDAMPLAPGDLLAVFDAGAPGRGGGLLHTAVYVGAGLFFEKADTELKGRDYPYRLVTAEQLLAPVVHFMEGAPLNAVAFRPVVELPPAAESFAATSPAALAAWERRSGTKVGATLAGVYELAADGAVAGEWLTAIDRVALRLGPGGRGTLADRGP